MGILKKENMDDKEVKHEYDVAIGFRDGTEAEYLEIAGYQVGSAVVAVMTKEGSTHVYPLDTVAYITHTVSE